MKRVLVIDGGGCKGMAPAVVLTEIEHKVGKPISQIFDLVVGTSVGAILTGIMATGKLTATQTLELMYQTLPRIFTRRMWPLLPKYPRQPFIDAWKTNIGTVLMRECKTDYLATAVSTCDSLTHYFKSCDPKDKELTVLDVVLRSFAAPAYFGGVVDDERKTVWLDGGTGIDNCPVLEPLWEIADRGWHNEGQVYILSLGCGAHNPSQSFERSKRRWCKNFREIGLYTSMSDGGLARIQSRRSRVEFAEKICGEFPGVWFNRCDVEIPEEMDIMDGVKYLQNYANFGEAMTLQVNWPALMG
jgi:hypothetical protein